ncbi:MAG: hypothetical protein QF443_05010, partial [Dehalococcoidia bacterium]|nr:hypothetical protein [Dehalococcoidia bacterium]
MIKENQYISEITVDSLALQNIFRVLLEKNSINIPVYGPNISLKKRLYLTITNFFTVGNVLK